MPNSTQAFLKLLTSEIKEMEQNNNIKISVNKYTLKKAQRHEIHISISPIKPVKPTNKAYFRKDDEHLNFVKHFH